ncbi:M20/M25/M40 family metallo-hydrolase [Sphingomonas hankyongi]|uniref:Vacuolar membrane protease n=1 Tax=Sphingomonas hankyongi TaxID=2908209 RepID=A0ABT0S3C0_9SPHN|nr:M28 family peptidase [Sphingomonas hankyongi]MCL6730352.1 M28 family peptidase [Sphingomonas hankyongi]
MGGWWRGLLVVGLLLAGFAVKGALIAPPALPNAGEFDVDRAVARLQRILGDQRPHPVDSDAGDAVRDRLIAELRGVGLQPLVRDAVDCSALPGSRVVSCSRVRNVVATVGAERPGRHVLLDAHYDSTPTGPGAADDGIGVATLLEVAAVLQSSPPPRPVTFLFNEGEEFGLNGSSAFMSGDPLARQVNSLINVEARGVTGPATMFETSEPNGPAISAYASASTRPFANSLSTDFAKLIPNYTDVVELKPAGWTILNYAIIGNETRYHTPGDTVASLDRRSVAHMGSEVLGATRALAGIPEPAAVHADRAVFTDIAGRWFIRVPIAVAATAVGLLLLVSAFVAWHQRAYRRPLIVAVAMALSGTVAAGLLGFALTSMRAGDFWRAYPLATYLGIYAALLAAMTATWARWGRGIDLAQARPAVWLLILLLGAVTSIVVPGAMIFFLFAPAIALLGIAAAHRSRAAGTVLNTVAIAVQFVMFAQLLAQIEMLLIDGPLWAVAPLAALSALPALVETDPQRLRPTVAASLVGMLALCVMALALPRSSSERPAAFTIDYFRDLDRREAKWAVATKQAPLPAGFPGKWSRGILPYNGRTRWIADAPDLDVPLPQARLIDGRNEGQGRRVRIAVSPGGANAVAIRFDERTMLVALGRPGQLERIPTKGEPDKAVVRCSGRTCEGFVVEALLADRQPIEAEVIATRFGLPPQGRTLVNARPVNAHPQYAPDSTISLDRVKF